MLEQEQLEARVAEMPAMERTPYFCSGCPHNTGTRVPEGSIALAGIGCHFMAQWMERSTAGFTQMGGEGASWIGEAPFVKTQHVFQNIGDGTYFHSGFLAVRAAIASGVNITFKILYNDAVAMTGGQHIDGNLTPPQIARELLAEGVKKVVVVTDEPEKYGPNAGFPPEVQIHHRDDYDAGAARDSARSKAPSAIIYDQTCAAEKRRRRKRNAVSRSAQARVHQRPGVRGLRRLRSEVQLRVGAAAGDRVRPQAPDRPVLLQQGLLLREGLLPQLRHRARRRVAQGQRASGRKRSAVPRAARTESPALEQPYGILVTGVGGTGVVTIGAIVGMAAHLEGKGFASLDMAGLAQKGGAVWSHLQIAAHPDDIKTVRLGSGGAQLVLGCDLVVSASQKTMDTTRAGRHEDGGQHPSADDRRLHAQRQLHLSGAVARSAPSSRAWARATRSSSMPRASPPR